MLPSQPRGQAVRLVNLALYFTAFAFWHGPVLSPQKDDSTAKKEQNKNANYPRKDKNIKECETAAI